MSTARIAGPLMTAGALIALIVSTLLAQPGTPSSAAVQTPLATPAATTPNPRADAVARGEAPRADLDSVRLLRQAGLTEAAVAELRRWIQQNPATPLPADVRTLLAELVDNSLALARAYSKVGLKEQARSSLQAWMQQHPNEELPADLVPLLVPSTDESLRVVRAYMAAGLLDTAVTELQQWVKAHPEQPIPSDLRQLLPTELDGQWWWLRKSLRSVMVPALAAASALIVAGLLLIRALGLLPPQLVVTDFEASGTDVSLGKRLSTRLRQRLAQPSAATPSLRVASGPVVPDPIPADIASDLASTAPIVKFAASAFRWIRPSGLVTINGVLHPTGRRGVGLTLIAAVGKSVSGGITIWEQEFDPCFKPVTTAGGEEPKTASVAYDILLPPAETWLRGHLRQQYGMKKPGKHEEADWSANALFDAGALAARQGRTHAAQTLYLRALAIDPQNLDAQLNLALLLPPTEVREQITQLRAVAARSKGLPRQTTFYSAAFSLAMLLVDDQQPAEAARVAGELVAEIDRTIDALEGQTGGRPGDEAEALKGYLRLIGPSARVIAAALRNESLPGTLDTAWPAVDFQYNLACYYSMRGNEQSLTRSIEHLEFAAALDRMRVVSFAKSDVNSVLKNVGTSKTTHDRFAKLVARTGAEIPTPSSKPCSILGTLDIIGAKRAAALAAQQIQAPGDLVVACSELATASALAASVDVELATVLRWARAAELMRLKPISAAHVNALVVAGYDSVMSLRGVSPATLRGVIRDWDKGETPPASTAVDAWVMEAMKMVSLVAAAPTR